LGPPTTISTPWAAATGHPLAGAEHFTPEDLAAQKWIGVMRKEGVSRQDSFLAACAKAGFAPEISLEASEPLAALGLVAAGLGMTMVQQSLRHQAPAGVTLHEVPWFNYRTSLWVAWHRINLRPLVESFRKTLIEAPNAK
jgi:DNA-binding transcriptional LysR family regulator